MGSYDFSVTADFTARTLNGSWSNINVSGSALGGTAITNETLNISSFSYANKSGIFDPQGFSVQSTSDANYWIEGGTTFVDRGAAKPNLVQGLFIVDSSINEDVVGGMTVIAPQ